jgi:Ni,Fe-hydrogenase III component G
MALSVVPGDLDSATKAFADLKAELDKERAAWIASQVKINVLTQAVKDLKITAGRFTTQIPTLEDKVKHLKNTVVDGLNEVRARELCFEHTTRANEDYNK